LAPTGPDPGRPDLPPSTS